MSYLTEEEARLEHFPSLQVALEDESETEMSQEEITHPKIPDNSISDKKKTVNLVSENNEDSSLSVESNSKKEPKKEGLLKTISTVYEDLQKTNEELESLNKNLYTYINKMIDTQKSLVTEDSKSSANDEALKSSYIDETYNENCSDKIASNLEADISKHKIDDKSKSESEYYIPVIDSSLSQLERSGTDVSQNLAKSDFTEVTVLSQANDLQKTCINHDNLTAVVVHSTSHDKEQTAEMRKVFMDVESNTSNCPLPNYAYHSYPSYSGNARSYAVPDRYSEPNTKANLTSQDSLMNFRHYSTFEAFSNNPSEHYPRTSHSYVGTHKDDHHHPQNPYDTADRIPHQYCNDCNIDTVRSDENEGKSEQFITVASSHALKNINDPTERQETDGKADQPSNQKRIFDRSDELFEDSIAQNIIKRYGEYKRNITDKGNESDPFRPNVPDDNQNDSNEGESKADVVKDPSGPLSRSKFTYGEYRRNLLGKTFGNASDTTFVKDPVPGSSVTRTPNERRSEQPNLSSNVSKRYSDNYRDSNRNFDPKFTYSTNPRRDRQSSNDMEMVSSEDEMTQSSAQPSLSVEFHELRSVLDSADTNEIMPWYLPKQNISVVGGKKESKSSCNKNYDSHLVKREERKNSVFEQSSEISRLEKRNDSTDYPSSQKSDGKKSWERKECRNSSSAQRLDFEKVCDLKESKNSSPGQKVDTSKLNERKEVKGKISDKGWDPTKSRYGQRPGNDEISARGERSFNPFSPFSPSSNVEVEKSEKQELVGTSSQKLTVKERDPAEILSAILANREKDKDRGLKIKKKRHLEKTSSSSTQKRKAIPETSKKEPSLSKNDVLAVISEPVVSSTNDFVNADSCLEKNNTTPDQNAVPDSSTNSIETVSANEKEHEDVLSKNVSLDFLRDRETQDADDLDAKEFNLSASLSNAVEQDLSDTDIKMSVFNEERICKVNLVDIFWKAKRDGKFKKKRIHRLIEKVVKKFIRHEKSKLRLLSVKSNNPESSIVRPEITSKVDDTQEKFDEPNICLSSGEEREIRTTGIGNTKKRKRLLSDENEDEVLYEESTKVLLQSTVSDSLNLTKKPKQDFPLSVDTKQEITDRSSSSDSEVMCPVSHEAPDREGEREEIDGKLIQNAVCASESKLENLLDSNIAVKDIRESGGSGEVSILLKSNEDSDKSDVTSVEQNVPITSSVALVSDEIPSESSLITSVKEEDEGKATHECNLKEELLNLPEIVKDNPSPVSADLTNTKVQLIITDMDAAERGSGIKVDVSVKDYSEENISVSQRNTTLKSVSANLNVQSENSEISPLCEDTSSSSLPLPIIENVTNEINKSLLEIDSTPNTLIEASSDSAEEEEYLFLKNLDSFLTDLSKISEISEKVFSAHDSSGEVSTVEECGTSKVNVGSSDYGSNERSPVTSSRIKETDIAASVKSDSSNIKEETKSAFNEEQSTISRSKQVGAASSFVSLAEASDINSKDEVGRTKDNSEEICAIDISRSNKQNISDVEKGDSIEINENSSSASLNNKTKKLSCQLEGEHTNFTSSEQFKKSEKDTDFQDKICSSARNSEETNSTDSSNVPSLLVNSRLVIEEKGNSVISNENIHESTGSKVDKTDGVHLDMRENFVENSISLKNLGKCHTQQEEEGNCHDQIPDKSISLVGQQEEHANQYIEKNSTGFSDDLCNEENKSSSVVLEREIKIEKTVTDSTDNYSGIESPKLEKHLKEGKGKVTPVKTSKIANIDEEESKNVISANENVSFPNEEKRVVEGRVVDDVKITKKKKVQKKEKDDRSGKSRMFTDSKNTSISGGNKGSEPINTSLKTTEEPKFESSVELTKKDSSQVKARLDRPTESNKSPSANSEPVEGESNVIVSSNSNENCSGIESPKLEKHLKEGKGEVKPNETSTNDNIDGEERKNLILAEENVNFPNEEKLSAVGRDVEEMKKTKKKKVQEKEKGERSGKSKKFTDNEKKSISGGNQGGESAKISVRTTEKSKCEPDIELSRNDSNQVKSRLDRPTESNKSPSANSKPVEGESNVIVSSNSNENCSGIESPKLEKHLKEGKGEVKPNKTSTNYNIDGEERKNLILAEENVNFPNEKKRSAEGRDVEVKKAKKKKFQEKEKGERSGKSKKFTDNEKKSISGGNQGGESAKISVRKTEKSKCEPDIELSRKDSSQLKTRFDRPTESSKSPSANSEPVEGESNVIVSSNSNENCSGIESPKLEKHLKESKGELKPNKTSTNDNIDGEERKNLILAEENVNFPNEEKRSAEGRDVEEVKRTKKKKVQEKEKGERSGKSKKFTDNEKKSISGGNQGGESAKTSVRTTEKSKREPGIEFSRKDSNQAKARFDRPTESNKSSGTNSGPVEGKYNAILSKDSKENYSGIESLKIEKHLKEVRGKVKPNKGSTIVNIDEEESNEEKRSVEGRDIKDVKKTKKKKVQEKEKGDRSGESKKFTESEKNSITGCNKGIEPSKTSLETTTKSKCEPDVELTKKYLSQVKTRRDPTKSSEHLTTCSEPAEDESSEFVSKAYKRIEHSDSEDEGLEDDAKNKISKFSKSESKSKNLDRLSQVSSNKKATTVEVLENIRDFCEESEKSVPENVDEDRKLENRKSSERNPVIDHQNLEESLTSHSVENERKSSSDDENKNERSSEGLSCENKPKAAQSSKRSNLFKCIVCKKKYCTNKREGTRLGNYSRRIAAFCLSCYIDLYKTNYISVVRKLPFKRKSKEN